MLVLTAIAVGVTVHRQHVAPRASGRERRLRAFATPTPVIAYRGDGDARSSRPAARAGSSPPLTMPADTFKVGSLVHLEKDGGAPRTSSITARTPDEIVLKRVTAPHRPVPDA